MFWEAPERRIESIPYSGRLGNPGEIGGVSTGSYCTKIKCTPASNELERKIAAIWEEVLGIGQVGVHDDFFELGGNSLVGLQVIARINRTMHLSVELRAVFELPTVASQARMIGIARQLGGDELAAPDADLIDVLI